MYPLTHIIRSIALEILFICDIINICRSNYNLYITSFNIDPMRIWCKMENNTEAGRSVVAHIEAQ
jgi:hypothetical protein